MSQQSTRCTGLNRHGKPCASPVVDPLLGKCAAHSGIDMRARGRRGGIRSGQVRRTRGMSLAALVRERLEQEADETVREFQAAVTRRDRGAAEAILDRVFGRRPDAVHRVASTAYDERPVYQWT